MAMRLTYLFACFGLAASALEDGLEGDEVTFVQMNVSKRGSMGAGNAFHQDFRLEDAESLVDIAYEAAHDESKPTVEEKAIALLQKLSRHRSVLGTGAGEALLKVAADARRVVDSSADEVEGNASRDEGIPGPFSGHWNPFHDTYYADYKTYDWVEITSDGGQAPEEGYCWHALGGKPLQCQLRGMNGKLLAQNPSLNYLDKGYDNPCEMLCARRSWCSGYGYKLTKRLRRQPKEVCILFNNGRGQCGNFFTLRGILPVESAKDLVLETGNQRFAEVLDEDGVVFRLPYVDFGAGKYLCKAKYSARSDSRFYNRDVDFVTRSPTSKCKHTLSKPGTDVYIWETQVFDSTLPFIDSRTFVDDDGHTKLWANRCEKLCAMLPWCTGYAYKARNNNEPVTPESCGLYRSLESLWSSKDSWQENTKMLSQAQMAMGNQRRAPSTGAKIASHFVPDPEEPEWMCKAKTYETKWRTNAGAGTNCKTGPLSVLMTTTMSLVSFLSAANCESLVTSNARVSMNASLLSPSAPATLLKADDALPLVGPKSFTKLFAVNSSRTPANLTEGHAKAALRHLLKDTEDDSKAILALKAGGGQTSMCQLQYAGQGLRFLSYSLASGFNTAYQCTVLHQDKYNCQSSLLRTTGGLFGSLMYGFPRLEQECGSNPWPVNTFTCSADFTKSTFYLGRAIWKLIQVSWVLGDEKSAEKVAGRIDMLASLTFIAEGILRAHGPCLGHFKGDNSAIKLENAGCIATIAEVSALSVQTMAYGVNLINSCRNWYKAPDWM